MRDTIRLQPLPRSVREARRFVAALTDDLPQPMREALELCVSELAANCVLHALTRYTVTVIREEDLRIEVADTGFGTVQPRDPYDNDLRGRGLRIVAALADSWGIQPALTPPGKTVWIQFDLAHPATLGT
jgi:anti-sigma regulatory factor (Ser/Thr protein kinase)